jgi:hypothetical protein
MKLSELKKPTNKTYNLTLLKSCPKARLIKNDFGATIEYNLMAGNFMITGQKNSPVTYPTKNITAAIKLAKTINHYNKTGETKNFEIGDIKELTNK